MTVTIKGTNKVMGLSEVHTGVDFNNVGFEEKTKRNGAKLFTVLITGDKRDKRISSANYSEITVQDEETGRFLYKFNR